MESTVFTQCFLAGPKIHQSVGVGNLLLEILQGIKMDLRTTERGRTWSFCSKSMTGYDWMIFGRLGLCSVFLGGSCGSYYLIGISTMDFKRSFFTLGETSWLLVISKCFGAGWGDPRNIKNVNTHHAFVSHTPLKINMNPPKWLFADVFLFHTQHLPGFSCLVFWGACFSSIPDLPFKSPVMAQTRHV